MKNKKEEGREFKLVIVSRDKTNIENILSNIDVSLETNTVFNNGMYSSTSYGLTPSTKERIVNVATVGPDVWVYEYSIRYSYFYNNYKYEIKYGTDLENVVDILYKTGILSTHEAMKIVLQKRLEGLKLQHRCFLLDGKGTVLYNSIISKLIKPYKFNEYSYMFNRELISNIHAEMNKYIITMRKYNNQAYLLQDLTYDKFMEVVEDKK